MGTFRIVNLAVSTVLGSFALAPALFGQLTTYSYSGDPYASAAAPYVVGGALQGTLTLASPLPPFQPLTDISPALVEIAFWDGVETRSLGNSFLCAVKVATDGAGRISEWQVSLRRFPYNPGDPQHSIDSSGQVGILGGIDFVGTGPAAVNPCGGVVLSPFADSASQGSWASDHPLPADPTTYTYTGDPYTGASSPYAIGGNLQGTLTTNGPLPAFLPLTDITSAIAGLSFSDDVETRSLADSFLCAVKVATDGAGRITQWQIGLRRFPYNPGDPQHAIDSSGLVGVISGNDNVGTGPAAANPCGGVVLSPAAGNGSQGTWTSDHALPTDPTVYTYTGDPYTTAAPPYAAGGNLQGTLAVAHPLPPFLPLTDISPAITAFAFADDVETRTLADSFLCSFKVATDGAGRITQWQIGLRRFPYNPGDPQHAIDSSGLVGVIGGIDNVGTGPGAADPCGGVVLSPSAGNGSQGTWTSDHALATDPTVYTYTGDPYTSASSPYVLGGNLQGTLTLARPLPAFLPLTDISPAIAAVSFSDDIETRTLADSFLCSFKVATDGLGQITQWQVVLRRFPYSPGDPQHAVDSSGQVGIFGGIDYVGTGPAAVNPCGGVALDPFASNGSPGVWTSDHRVSILAVPALGPVGLGVLSVLLAALGTARMAHRRRELRDRD